MNELQTYLEKLEKRTAALEEQSAIQAKRIWETKQNIPDIPSTDLLNKNFLSRAFTVWGHFMAANLLIGILSGIVYGIVIAATLIFAIMTR
jgi:hypothetical protein